VEEERRAARLSWGFVVACGVLVVAGWAPRLPLRPPPPVPDTPPIEVAVQGAVRAPGRYVLPWGARVGDLVDAAGGPTADAALDLIDPVAPLVDGDRVHVPARRADLPGGRISLNEASLPELESLPGIGPALAARIVAARPFHAIDELERVSGIGPATMERLRDRIAP
jgi:competence protein ComEA